MERERGFDIYWANSPDSLVLTNASEFRERQRKGDRDKTVTAVLQIKVLALKELHVRHS